MNWEETIFVASSKTACASNVQRMGTKKKNWKKNTSPKLIILSPSEFVQEKIKKVQEYLFKFRSDSYP